MIPHISDALFNLRPGASFQVHGDNYSDVIWLDEQQVKPSESEVLSELTRLLTEFNNDQYRRDRVNQYPSLADQLDMIYWDSVNGTENWKNMITSVKTQYPKAE